MVDWGIEMIINTIIIITLLLLLYLICLVVCLVDYFCESSYICLFESRVFLFVRSDLIWLFFLGLSFFFGFYKLARQSHQERTQI